VGDITPVVLVVLSLLPLLVCLSVEGTLAIAYRSVTRGLASRIKRLASAASALRQQSTGTPSIVDKTTALNNDAPIIEGNFLYIDNAGSIPAYQFPPTSP
jgi:hypothetical protein